MNEEEHPDKNNSSTSRRKMIEGGKKLKKELQDLRKENKQLTVINEKLKQRKKELERKIDSLKETNRKLLHNIEERKGENDEAGIRLPSDSIIKGDIESEKKIEVENEVRVLGSLRSEKDITLGYGNKIKGDVISEKGNVKVGNASEIGGVIKGNNIHLAEGVRTGQIKGKEKITIDDNCEVLDIFALGDVNIGEDVRIEGTIRHASDFSTSRGITVTDSIVPQSIEELDREAEKTMNESLPLLPMIIQEGFRNAEDDVQEKESKEEANTDSVRHEIDQVRGLIKSARDENIDISKERSDLKKGVSLFKNGEYEKAEDRFTKCKHSLEKKLGIDVEPEKEESEEDAKEQIFKESEKETELNESEKEKIIESFQTIQGVGPSIAEELYAGGFHSIEELRDASESELSEIEGIGKSFSKTIKDELD